MTNGGYAWASEPEKEFYKQAVRACLEDPRLSELLEQRPTVTREAVAETMCSAPYAERVLGSGRPEPHHSFYRDCRMLSDRYRWALPAYLSLREIKQNADFLSWCVGAVAYWALTLTVLMYAGSSPYLFPGVPFLLFVAPALSFVRRVPSSPPPTGASRGWFPAVRLALLAPVTSVLWLLEWVRGLFWATELRRAGLQKQVARAVEDLIGEDLGTLLVTSSHEGLRSHHQTSYVVDNHSTDELRQKMDQLADGTIALSGPRGVGKTTLIKSAVRPGDFAVFTHAPASYAPHDFLTSMFVSVCQQYIVRAGHQAPELVRLSYVHRVRRRLAGPLSGLLRLLPYALPAAGLLCLGMFAATKESLEASHGLWGWRYVDSGLDQATGFVQDIMDGKAPKAALFVAIAGALLWRLRRSGPFSWLAKGLGTAVVTATTALLFVAPIASLYFDPDLRHHFDSPPDIQSRNADFFALLLLTLAVWLGLGLAYTHPSNKRARLRVGTWSVSLKQLVRPLVVLMPFLILAWIAATEPLRPILTDDETPFRLGAFLLGLLIYRISGSSRPFLRTTPRLVSACRNHLYRLQTVQSSTAAMTTGATQFLALGGSHAGALTSVPPNYPILVAEFRALLGTIAEDEHQKGNRVVIAIDEVDRLGTDTQALAFLAEIKAILGVPHVHYLISVAEDVGAAFVRRGLPSRDVTDSSLDDVLHVRPCTLDESARILRKRAPHIGKAYIALAHALSGGIPRDLIRYGRRLMEIRTTTEQVELPDVTQALIIEELSETLAGFRTLLAKQQWGPDTAGVLKSFRSLAAHLRVACPCPGPAGQLRGALAHFVGYEVAGLPEESRRLVDEAAAYAYFSLTLLDVFGRSDFNQRRATAARRPDGYLDLLAEARQELAVSPHTARTVIDGIRSAWELEPVSARGSQPTVVIPPPRGTACVGNHSSP